MPQIDAPTVAEHRAQQREALLDAAEAILLEAGHSALTFRALGERTGLARNSIYRYFSSRDDLIAALCERDMPRWLEELEAAMAPPTGRTRGWRRSCRRSCGSSLTAATGWPSCSGTRRSAGGPARINALAYRPAALLEPELGAGPEARRPSSSRASSTRRAAAARRGDA